jgi:hypothetical protein
VIAWDQPEGGHQGVPEAGLSRCEGIGSSVLSNGERRLVIPRHDPINAITMGAIARDAGFTPQQFRELL